MKAFLIASLLIFGLSANAKDIFRIEIGQDYNNYSNQELKQRIWRLENAVEQLQVQVFNLKHSDTRKNQVESWSCTIKAMGEDFIATGNSKATAKANVIKECKKGNGGDGFFCKNPKCEQ
ncbi:MAG: hypothetical protein H6622_01665 [Halobacteriovoraceae bacterium]|nr:hypothetical protein [Halobacteriovoraceae bacterium]